MPITKNENGHLVVNNLVATSNEITQYFADISPLQLENEVLRILDLGCAVIQRVENSNEIDYIERRAKDLIHEIDDRFSRLENSFTSLFTSQMDPNQENSFMERGTRLIREVVGETKRDLRSEYERLENRTRSLSESLNPSNRSGYLGRVVELVEQFGDEIENQFRETDRSSFVGKLRTMVDEYFGDESLVLDSIHQRVEEIHKEIREDMLSMRDAVMRVYGQSELVERSTAKGFAFEDQVKSRLEDIARPYSDIVEDLTITPEVSGSKKGDYLYRATALTESIVIDAKNHGKLDSLPAALKYLNEAMRERDSPFGILVVPEIENLQKQVGEWNIYDGNKILTPLAFLEVSIKYAKGMMVLERESGESVNANAIRIRIGEIERKMKEFSSIKSKLTKLANGVMSTVTEVHGSLDGIREEILEKLREIDSEISVNAEAPLAT